MSKLTGNRAEAPFDEEALKSGVASMRHPLSRALLVLTVATGLIDAVSYLGLGHVFTANVTGNVVLLAFGIAGARGLPVLAPVVSLLSFLLGATAGGLLVTRMKNRHPSRMAVMLGIEVSLIAVAAGLAAATTVHPGIVSAFLIIALMALAMGMRNANARRLAVPDLPTTVLTMTVTGLAAESPIAGGSGEGSMRRAGAVVAMLGGALTGALLLTISIVVPLVVAAGLSLGTLLLYVPVATRLGGDPAPTPGPHREPRLLPTPGRTAMRRMVHHPGHRSVPTNTVSLPEPGVKQTTTATTRNEPQVAHLDELG
jgi:uncharacterized membrane protein YoaK (UPF0700 family)